MCFHRLALILVLAGAAAGCGGRAPATPLETFKTYTKAFKQKDTTTMKVLLSNESMKLHEQQAKAQGATVDDIIKRETLFSADQTTVEFRNEKIDGDKASLEVKNSFGMWETVPFVREDGVWKIDKKGYADQMQMDIEQQQNQQLDELINRPPTAPVPPGSEDTSAGNANTKSQP